MRVRFAVMVLCAVVAFSVFADAQPQQLWLDSDGADSFPHGFAELDGYSYFFASKDGQKQLWRTDGTNAGTTLVSPNAASACLADPVTFNGAVYFCGTENWSPQLWKTDGTQAGTVKVANLSSGTVAILAPAGNLLYMLLFGNDTDVWRSDGTAPGTFLLKSFPAESAITSFVALGDTCLFGAGTSIWRTDGTVNGTTACGTWNGGVRSLHEPVATATAAYFDSGTAVVRTDGTVAGTSSIELGATVQEMAAAAGIAYFKAGHTQLWAAAGDGLVVKLRDFAADYPRPGDTCSSGCVRIAGLAGASDRMYVTTGSSAYWSESDQQRFDGSYDLWTSTGTAAGTAKVTALPSGEEGAAFEAVAAGSRLYFTQVDPATGLEAWTSDGTAAGTHIVKDIAAGTYMSSSGPRGWAASPAAYGVFGSDVLFQATDRIHGFELWKSDGTEAGTSLVKNINPEGTISGRVYDAETNAPVLSASVSVYAVSGTPGLIRTATVDSDGNYTIEGLSTYTYYLQVAHIGEYAGQDYNGRDCFPCTDPAAGDGLSIVSPEARTNVDFALRRGGEIAGHVGLRSDNTPVANLDVTIAPAYGAAGVTVRTDANGDYRTNAGLPPGSYVVFTDAASYSGEIYDNVHCAAGCAAATAVTPVSVSAGVTMSGIDFTVAPRGIITGTITDAVTGEPLANAAIKLFLRNAAIATPAVSAVTGSDGKYTLTLPDGTYSLLIASTSYTSVFWPDASCTSCTMHAGTAVIPVPGATTTYDAALQPLGGRIRGSVKDAVTNAPITNIQLILSDSAGNPVSTARTAADGTYAFMPQLPSGTYYLRAQRLYAWELPAYVPEIWDGANGKLCNNCAVTTGTPLVINGTTVIDDIDFVIDRYGSIRARIYDASTSAPVSGIVVINDASGAVVASQSADGEYVFLRLDPGTYSMHLSSVGSYIPTYYGGARFYSDSPATGGTPVVVTLNDEVAADFPLQRFGHVAGRVTTPSGVALAGTRVEVWRAGGATYDWYVDTDSNGRYDALAAGEVVVKASHTGYATETHDGQECPNCYDVPAVTVAGGSTVMIDFVLGPVAHLTGKIAGAFGPTTGGDVQLFDSRGNLAADHRATYATFSFEVGAGTYYIHTPAMFGDVWPGYTAATYKAQNCATFCMNKALAINVASGGAVDITVPVTTYAKIAGTIRNAVTGAGITNVPVVVWDLVHKNVALEVTTGAGGAYSAVVPVGRYALYTNANAYDNQLWNGVACSGACAPTDGTAIEARGLFENAHFALYAKGVIPRDAYADLNADGKSEIVWRSGSGLFTMWEMRGRTIASTQTITTLTDPNWKVLGFGDFDRDGDDDFFFRNSVTGGTAMWIMNGKTIALNAPSTTVKDMNWQMHAIGDFNADGKDELIWRNLSTGQVAMWEMNGVFLANGDVFYNVADLDWEIVVAADFTGDKKDEILWRNKKTGALAMWELDGRKLRNGATFATVADLTWNIIAAGDYNGDGRADLLWRRSGSNMIAMWEMDGRTVLDGRSLIPVAPEWVIEHCGDFNGDKTDEILWRNTSTGQVAMWETSGHKLLNTATFAAVADLATKIQPRGGIRPALNSQ